MAIFNQEFKGTPEFRKGSAKDVEYLKVTFKRFGIEPMVKPDLKFKEIVKEIDDCEKYHLISRHFNK